jgi:hypothetical protein
LTTSETGSGPDWTMPSFLTIVGIDGEPVKQGLQFWP